MMLVLSRRLGDRIVIDGRITVEVVSIDRGKIRLGIEADKSVPIFRSELLAQPAPTTPLTGPQILDALGVNDDED